MFYFIFFIFENSSQYIRGFDFVCALRFCVNYITFSLFVQTVQTKMNRKEMNRNDTNAITIPPLTLSH